MRCPSPVMQQSHIQSSGFLPHFEQSTSKPPSTVQSPILLPPSALSPSCPPPTVQSSRLLPPSVQSTLNHPPSLQSPSIRPHNAQLPQGPPLTQPILHSMRLASTTNQASSSQLVIKANQSPNFLPLLPSGPK